MSKKEDNKEKEIKEDKVLAILKEKLNRSYNLRDFEIEHYWKRTNYFWGFTAATFAGFFLLISKSDCNSYNLIYLLIICSLGIIFSLGWWLVNLGSKVWQENWENKIWKYQKLIHEREVLIYSDDEILYTSPDVKYDYFKKPYSVSKVNLFISQIVFCLWWLLMAYLLIRPYIENYNLFVISIPISTFIIVILLFIFAKRTGNE